MRACRFCSAAFESRQWQLYCTKGCARRAQVQRKHMRRRGLRGVDPISIREVWHRDHGICGLCLRRVVPDFGRSGPLPRRAWPTLDHIVPISLGGVHTLANVQLAHYGCNSSKGNKVSTHLPHLLPLPSQSKPPALFVAP